MRGIDHGSIPRSLCDAGCRPPPQSPARERVERLRRCPVHPPPLSPLARALPRPPPVGTPQMGREARFALAHTRRAAPMYMRSAGSHQVLRKLTCISGTCARSANLVDSFLEIPVLSPATTATSGTSVRPTSGFVECGASLQAPSSMIAPRMIRFLVSSIPFFSSNDDDETRDVQSMGNGIFQLRRSAEAAIDSPARRKRSVEGGDDDDYVARGVERTSEFGRARCDEEAPDFQRRRRRLRRGCHVVDSRNA